MIGRISSMVNRLRLHKTKNTYDFLPLAPYLAIFLFAQLPENPNALRMLLRRST